MAAALLPAILLLLLAVSGGADHAPAPGPGVSAHAHAPGGPSLAPESSPSPASPSPEYLHSPPAPPSPSPVPAPAADLIRAGIGRDHAAEETPTGGGMSGGNKAGIAVGVLVCVAAVGLGVMVYKKRQENIRRTRYGYSGGRVEMF